MASLAAAHRFTLGPRSKSTKNNSKPDVNNQSQFEIASLKR